MTTFIFMCNGYKLAEVIAISKLEAFRTAASENKWLNGKMPNFHLYAPIVVLELKTSNILLPEYNQSN